MPPMPRMSASHASLARILSTLEIPRGRWVLKAKILGAKYEAKQKTFHGGVWIFFGTTLLLTLFLLFLLLSLF